METGEDTAVAAARTDRAIWRVVRIGGLGLLAMLVVGLLIVWLTRERIADNVIGDQLAQYDLPATYEIGSIGPARQVVRNVILGDPDNPDLTIEQVTVNLRYRFGFPAIGRVELVRPRLLGRVKEDGTLSFGTLDKVIYAGSDRPPGLPDLDLKLTDGRARIETPWGGVGIKAEGEGELDDGFAGKLAAIAPNLAYGGCDLQRLTLYGDVTVSAGKPAFAGPLRMDPSRCAASGIALDGAELALRLTGDATLDGGEGSVNGTLGRLAFNGGAVQVTELKADASLRGERLVSGFDAALGQAMAAQMGFAVVRVTGSARTDVGLAALQSDIELEGEDLLLDPALSAALREAQGSAVGTLAAPLLGQLAGAIEREVRGASLAADLTVRTSDGTVTFVAPRISLAGRGGDTLAALSRVEARFGARGVPLLSGNIAMGGAGLPQVQGRMERDGGGNSVFRIRMAPYEAQGSRLAFSDLEIRQARSGAMQLAGAMQADGPLPGGEVRGLNVPIAGQLAANGNFSMWQGCTPIAFERLSYYDLTLDAKQMTLCPQSGQPIVRYDADGLRVAAGTAALDIKGNLAGSPLTLSTGPVGLAWPGTLVANDVSMVIGNDGSAARFKVAEFGGELGQVLSGTFAMADIALDPVPLDIFDASGNWSYQDSVLTIGNGAFRVEDREDEDRFYPLVARGAGLVLQDSRIMANAALREPSSQRVVTAVEIRHDLGSGVGSADLDTAGLRFDGQLQPVTLTELAKGLVALADGTIRGEGRIDWNGDAVTSTGRFSTDRFDLAAPFGPVKGASGTIVFDDLLSLTTAPNQRLFVQSVNPGIEAEDGEIVWQLTNGTLLDLKGGTWPWLGGTLTMRRSLLDFSKPEERRYIFEIEGLDAALFIERLEMSNLAARGTFDGTVQVYFDEFGNGFIEESVLIARPPGGNLSYVGELTYEDMGAIANFAFRSLQSLDFRQMRVGVEGPLSGEVLTAISFEGVSQGEGASRNFVTRRLAKLPIRFNVNIRAPFYQLLNNMRSLYDPDYVPDPQGLGLLDKPTPPAAGLTDGTPPIQDRESED
ncbi:intermembrane phospholipid transport protein YdbH family protein [Parerythrobacter aestuarii]|uniref:intermembrane phospholipid transport protein YdbH family protein n=1 Tax=Parerythrobacter aestuarii TaxID=3020909 RepID=UPI0024DEC610|nr:YdbH domain-containing protein [Parerythrobacter aestuarii]